MGKVTVAGMCAVFALLVASLGFISGVGDPLRIVITIVTAAFVLVALVLLALSAVDKRRRG